MTNIHPLEIASQLETQSQTEADPAKRAALLEAAEHIKYLLSLLELSAQYIQDNNEYDADPRFLKAIRELFPKKSSDIISPPPQQLNG